jgi:hypothetical protein
MGDGQRILARRDLLSLGEIDFVNAERSQQVRHKKHKSKKPYVLIGILLLLFVSGSVFSLVGYQMYSTRYRNDLSEAQMGM